MIASRSTVQYDGQVSTCLVALLPGVRTPERLLQWCRDSGVTIALHEVDPAADLPRIENLCGVLVVGGAVSPYDERIHTRGLGALLATSVGREMPTLGSGGGAHFVAWALGAQPGIPEPIPVRLRAVTRTAQGRLDPLFSRVPSTARWIEWSDLGLTRLPVGSTVLAVDESGLPQAVRFGPQTWGLQGHPYLDRAALTELLEAGHPLFTPEARAALEPDLERMDAVCSSWEPMFSEFLAMVASGSPGRGAAGGTPRHRF